MRKNILYILLGVYVILSGMRIYNVNPVYNSLRIKESIANMYDKDATNKFEELIAQTGYNNYKLDKDAMEFYCKKSSDEDCLKKFTNYYNKKYIYPDLNIGRIYTCKSKKSISLYPIGTGYSSEFLQKISKTSDIITITINNDDTIDYLTAVSIEGGNAKPFKMNVVSNTIDQLIATNGAESIILSKNDLQAVWFQHRQFNKYVGEFGTIQTQSALIIPFHYCYYN